MHIIDIWLEELQMFHPSNLKQTLISMGQQLISTFGYLCSNWWWLTLPLTISPALFFGLMQVTSSDNVLYFARIAIFAAKVYFSFIVALSSFPYHAPKSPAFFSMRQNLFWPIVTPFVLWFFAAPHVYRFFSLAFGMQVAITLHSIATWVTLTNVDWFASPFYVFFAFIIFDTYSMYGVLHALEHAAMMMFYTLPTTLIMFALLFGFNLLLQYGTKLLIDIYPYLGLFNSMVLIIPVAVELFGSVYQWHMQLIRDDEIR